MTETIIMIVAGSNLFLVGVALYNARELAVLKHRVNFVMSQVKTKSTFNK